MTPRRLPERQIQTSVSRPSQVGSQAAPSPARHRRTKSAPSTGNAFTASNVRFLQKAMLSVKATRRYNLTSLKYFYEAISSKVPIKILYSSFIG